MLLGDFTSLVPAPPPRCSADVLCSVLEHRMCFMEKTHVLGQLCSDVSYSAIGCEFNINESIIYSK